MPDPTPEQPNPPMTFDDIVDDEPAKTACARWAADQIHKGRTVPEMVAELTANGWSQRDATEICEDARCPTLRYHRPGPITRDEVARSFGVNDPHAMHHAMLIGFAPMLGMLTGLARGIRRLWITKDVRPPK